MHHGSVGGDERRTWKAFELAVVQCAREAIYTRPRAHVDHLVGIASHVGSQGDRHHHHLIKSVVSFEAFNLQSTVSSGTP